MDLCQLCGCVAVGEVGVSGGETSLDGQSREREKGTTGLKTRGDRGR